MLGYELCSRKEHKLTDRIALRVARGLDILPTGKSFKREGRVGVSVSYIYSNKKETSDFHGAVSFYPVKMSQQKINQNVNQTSDTQKMKII